MTADEIEAHRARVAEGAAAELLARLAERARPVLERMPVVPRVKALLSADGGTCPGCGGALEFDPWEPTRHRCGRCGAVATGDRHDRSWARAQHLWLAERAAHLATVGVLAGDTAAITRARALLAAYHELYLELPNADNVLGPSRLFFSTYLESIWILSYLAAAQILREAGELGEPEIEAVNTIADEAARMIGEFDEGLSNRQVWNSAALTAIAAWFGDDELAETAIAGRTGLIGLLADGFGDDGMWWEGENYHLFAIRGWLLGLEWARVAGVGLLEDERLAATLGRALMAPAATALPDFTFPARKDARFGVSLAHPAYLECWEAGAARLGEAAPGELAGWLAALYRRPARTAQTYDAYLHDAGEAARERTGFADLSWWMAWTDGPTGGRADQAVDWEGQSVLLEAQGVAVLRRGDRYVAVECGRYGGGHGHPDRLHLTVHQGGVHWLADPGTGSYVAEDLFWYRSTMAHNAPLVGGVSQEPGDARCAGFGEQGDWGWIVAAWGECRRTVVTGPEWLLDLVELEAPVSRRLELPWHLDGEVSVETAGAWIEEGADQRFEPAAGADVVVAARSGDRTVRLHLVGGTVLRAEGPGRPGGPRRPFHRVRADGTRVRLAAVLDFGGRVEGVTVGAERIEVAGEGGVTAIRLAAGAATVTPPGGGAVSLGGARAAPPDRKPMLTEKPLLSHGEALRVDDPPALDGTLDGFDPGAPLELADEGHYFRSEEPYPGPELFSATGYVNWDEEHLYLAVEVVTPEVIARPADAAPLLLDNDPDDIHSAGIQVYYRVGKGPARAFLIRPTAAGGILARPIPGGPGDAVPLPGASARTDAGYTVTVALPAPELLGLEPGASLGFDLCVNQMEPERIRRAGQLAWGGGNGWVYLRSDRRDESRWGTLELIG